MRPLRLVSLSSVPAPDPPTRPRAVVTFAAGPSGRELLTISGPLMREYAARIGADFRVIEPAGDDHPWPLAYKFAVRRYLELYRRVIYFDADVVVQPDCPDLFAIVPATHVSMYDDLPDFPRSAYGAAWYPKECRALQISQGWPVEPVPVCWNSGIYVASRCHADVFQPPRRRFPNTWCAEQATITLNILQAGVPVHPLPLEANTQFWSWQNTPEWDRAWVRHYSGMRMDHVGRIAAMKADVERIEKL